MARVGLDLDGVLYDFSGALRQYLVTQYSWDEKWCTEPTRWEFYEDWGLSLAGFKKICHQAADNRALWNTREPLGGWPVISELRHLREAGHTLHVITNRGFGTHPGESHADTAEWLSLWKIPYDTLTFSGDKTIVHTDFMIEDNVDNYLALEKSGCAAVLINRPWNEYLKSAVRVFSVKEFVDLVLREAA